MRLQGFDIWTKPDDYDEDDVVQLEDSIHGVTVDGEEVRCTIE